MQEPNEAEFHDRVREALGAYRPEPRPEDWQRMRRALRRRQWLRLGIVGVLCVVSGLLAGKWLAETGSQPAPGVATTDTAAAPSAPPTPEETESGLEMETRPLPEEPPGESGNPVAPGRPGTYEPARAFRQRNFPGVALPRLRPEAPSLPERPAAWAPPLRLPSPEEAAITHQLLTGTFGPDSTSYRVLARNLRRWPDAVIVCDLTTSMYPYGTQLFAWFRKNRKHLPVQGIVFFTDCDSLGRETVPGGPPGQMFVTGPGDVGLTLPVMLAAARNTVANARSAENDVEALLFAQQRFPAARHLVLLADNRSPVKDMARLGGVNRPVHVVLCGAPGDSTKPFWPDYYAIARRTGGSLHTLEDDFTPGTIRAGTWIRVGSRYYRYQKRHDRFKATRFRHRPRRVLRLFWF
ncbi:MAG: hypothetical protein AVDCRST_MAG56-3270 [uncultured Cytophagales bacterium]|uniref:Uncharacterized protein n=1 Tax=uncultured Cytophagales bacterium TaxID=158755 RepID=A0A6J4JDP2_9SPHI|nr:MAG: hypothetical protein AVDCRST_MAG56-3270 [uncultured Cytophagales bacterium]